jgi:hypothetical protein
MNSGSDKIILLNPYKPFNRVKIIFILYPPFFKGMGDSFLYKHLKRTLSFGGGRVRP